MLKLDSIAFSSTADIQDLFQRLIAKGWKHKVTKTGITLDYIMEKEYDSSILICYKDEYAGKLIIRLLIQSKKSHNLSFEELCVLLKEIGWYNG